MRRPPPGKYAHRCMRRLDEWVKQNPGNHGRGARRRKRCMTRLSFSLRRKQPPRCPSCGSREHWRLENRHRRKDRERENCYSTACPYAWTGPHSVYSEHCINNPGRDPLEMGGERLTGPGDDVPF